MNFAELQQLVDQSRNIVFFGGAGTSTESGIPDFRSSGGLYNAANKEKYSPEEILSHRFFMERTEEFYDFYKKKMIYPDAQPNLAHEALAKLEKTGRLKAIITQNIDGLHQKAGSNNVLELHGSVQRNYCVSCRTSYPLAYLLESADPVPRCQSCGGIIKPDVVLYEESLDLELLQRAHSYIKQADVLIVAGTSLTVQPAAGLIHAYEGNKLILINKSPTPMDGIANYVLSDSVGKVLHALISES
jgi:NAD-dependent deacetylase